MNRSHESTTPFDGAVSSPNPGQNRGGMSSNEAALDCFPPDEAHKGHRWVVGLSVLVEGVGVQVRGIRVTTQDISRGGFSFIYGQALHPGTRIRVCFDMLPQKPVLAGTVRECGHLKGMEHLVAVEFDP